MISAASLLLALACCLCSVCSASSGSIHLQWVKNFTAAGTGFSFGEYSPIPVRGSDLYVPDNNQVAFIDGSTGVVRKKTPAFHTAVAGVSCGSDICVASTVLHFEAFDARTGEHKWRIFCNNTNTGIVLGPCLTPSIVDGFTHTSTGKKIVVLVNGSGIFAVSQADGSPLWAYMPAHTTVFPPVVVDHGIVYASGGEGTILGFDVTTGAEVVEKSFISDPYFDGSGMCVAGSLLVSATMSSDSASSAGSMPYIGAINATSSEHGVAWSAAVPVPNENTWMSITLNRPVCLPDEGIVVVTGNQLGFAAFSLASGSLQWQVDGLNENGVNCTSNGNPPVEVKGDLFGLCYLQPTYWTSKLMLVRFSKTSGTILDAVHVADSPGYTQDLVASDDMVFVLDSAFGGIFAYSVSAPLRSQP